MGLCFESEMYFWSTGDFRYSKNNDGIFKNIPLHAIFFAFFILFSLQVHLNYYLSTYTVLTFVEESSLQSNAAYYQIGSQLHTSSRKFQHLLQLCATHIYSGGI